jgi:hypothetical protein
MIANITQENLHLGYKAKNKAEVLPCSVRNLKERLRQRRLRRFS